MNAKTILIRDGGWLWMFLLVLAAVALATGCATSFELLPGDKVIVGDVPRAQEFRAWSGSDQTHTGRVVTVTAPTTIKR
jgi:hypothetical protein